MKVPATFITTNSKRKKLDEEAEEHYKAVRKKQYQKAYYTQHKEGFRVKNRGYYNANRETLRAKAKQNKSPSNSASAKPYKRT